MKERECVGERETERERERQRDREREGEVKKWGQGREKRGTD